MTRKYFGTDGVRGKVGDFPITPDFILKLGWAAGRVLSKTGTKKVLIGKDTRISGYMLESALEAGLSAAGLQAAFTGPMPTPAVAYLTQTFRAEAGIVISASHNPYYDNGIKFFSSQGTKLPDDIELAIEAELEKPLTCVESAELGKAKRIVDAAGRYIEFCKGTFPSHMSLEGSRLLLTAPTVRLTTLHRVCLRNWVRKSWQWAVSLMASTSMKKWVRQTSEPSKTRAGRKCQLGHRF